MREPDTTTPEHTSTTPAPSEDRDITVYVEELNNIEVSNCILLLMFSSNRPNSDAGNCNIKSSKQITITGQEVLPAKRWSA